MAAAAQEKYRKRREQETSKEEEQRRARESRPQTRTGQSLPSRPYDARQSRPEANRGIAGRTDNAPQVRPARPPGRMPGGGLSVEIPRDPPRNLRPQFSPAAPTTGGSIAADLMARSPRFAASQGAMPAIRPLPVGGAPMRMPAPMTAPAMAPNPAIPPVASGLPARTGPAPGMPVATPPYAEEPQTGMPMAAIRNRAPTMTPGPGAGPVASPVVPPRMVGPGNPMAAPQAAASPAGVPFGTAMGTPGANPTPAAAPPAAPGGLPPQLQQLIAQMNPGQKQMLMQAMQNNPSAAAGPFPEPRGGVYGGPAPMTHGRSLGFNSYRTPGT